MTPEEQFHQLMQSKNETFIHRVRAVELHAPPNAGRRYFDDLRERLSVNFCEVVLEDLKELLSVTSLSVNNMILSIPEFDQNALFFVTHSMV